MIRLVASVLACAALVRGEGPRVVYAGDFAPADGWVKASEKPLRAEVCLNGSWQFQPVAVPSGFKRGTGEPPPLPLPGAEGWDPVPIRIPSPWNVNTWGGGRNTGAGTERLFWPDSIYFPSYPGAWDKAEMGWLRRVFRVPADWGERRVVLHFEAVAGDCQVLVNGQPAGTHFDKYLPFELDITRLVRREGDNELLVGVRAHVLFNKQSQRYPKMRAPYPCGSATEKLAGIWQDVFLLGLPPVRIADVFIKPLVDRDTLELEVTVRNDSEHAQSITVGGEISSAFALTGGSVTVPAGSTTKLTLRERVDGRLKLWAPGSPNLYAAALTLKQGDRAVDSHFTRFGWRQFAIRGSDLVLNGQPIKLTGDFLHPFGPFILSRGYVQAWYRLIQDFGGNSVRPHAQPHPRHYLELADEMGLVALDETAIFGSAISLNFEEPLAWQRFAEHYDGLVLRDRNHPSVLGWSFGNELFAIFDHNNVPKDIADGWYRQLTELGMRARRLDPTRDWISCDGDEDLRGTMPVWSKHFGHGTPLDRLPPNVNKPLMVGESGGTYYARPKQMAEFNGARAFESYAGRNEALAIDVYDNILRMALPRLAYFSASETAWFGVEHLSFGYRDFTRLPGKDDGVFFTKPFAEGKPGIQPERLPPYVAALNPGWDLALPDLYFAEDGPDRFIMRHGLAGPAVERGRVLLRASDTDWSLFNEAPEHAKCAAVVLHEHLVKPSGAALVETAHGNGKLLLCSLDWRVASRPANAFWRRLLTNAGIKLGEPADANIAAFDEHGALLNALSIGRFPAASVEAALNTDFIGETRNRGTEPAGTFRWHAVSSPSRDRFVFHQLKQTGPKSGAFAVYFSCWLRSPRALDDLLADGPDAPRLNALCHASEQCRMFLNGREAPSARQEPADYRTRYHFERLPLKKGWNHLLFKVAAAELEGEHPATLAVRITSNNPDYLRQVESAVEVPSDNLKKTQP